MSEPESLVAGLRAEIDRLRAYGFALRSRCETLEREKGAAIASCRVAEADAELWQIQVDKAIAARDEAVAALEDAREALRVIATGSGYEWSETREQLHRIIDAAVECASNALTQPSGKEKGDG